MKSKIRNFFNAIAPLTQYESSIGEMLIISYLESLWTCNTCKEVHVNDLVKGIKHYSSASIHRKLRQLKKKKILLFELSPTDERVRIIKKGLHYNDYLEEIESSLKNNPVELSKADKKNYLRIKTSGQIDFDKQIYLYNLNKSGKPGFEVINPILIGNENYLINRGWISFDQKDQSEINFVNEDKIIGTLKLQTKASTFKPENDIEKNYWFTLNRDDVFKYTGKNFSNFIIFQ